MGAAATQPRVTLARRLALFLRVAIDGHAAPSRLAIRLARASHRARSAAVSRLIRQWQPEQLAEEVFWPATGKHCLPIV